MQVDLVSVRWVASIGVEVGNISHPEHESHGDVSQLSLLV